MKIAQGNEATSGVPADANIPDTVATVPTSRPPHLPPSRVHASSASTAREQDVTSTEKEQSQEEGCREPEMRAPRAKAPSMGGLSRGSAEVGAMVGAWGPAATSGRAPRGQENLVRQKVRQIAGTPTLDPALIPPLLRSTCPRKGAGRPSWAWCPPWAEAGPGGQGMDSSEITPVPCPLLPLQGGGQTCQAG